MGFPLMIRKMRESAGLSQVEMAEKLGVSRPFYSNIELGKRRPPPDCLTHFADALQLAGPAREDFLAAGYLEHAPQEVRDRIARLEKTVQWMAERVAEIEETHRKNKEKQ